MAIKPPPPEQMETPPPYQAWLERLPPIFMWVGAGAVLAAAGDYAVEGPTGRAWIVLLAIGLGLWVYALLERPRETAQALTGRTARYGANSAVMIVAFLAILVFANVLANRYSHRFDLTQDQVYTLSPQSDKILSQLKQPVQAYAFYRNGDPGQAQLEDLLKEYQSRSSLFSYQFVDPVLKPGLAQQYGVTQQDTTVLVSGDKKQQVTTGDEASITSALLKLESGAPKKVAVLTGHGEMDFSSTDPSGGGNAKQAIANDNYQVDPLDLASAHTVPTDTVAVLVAAPTKPFLADEVTALEKYIDGGGNVIFLANAKSQPVLEPIAEKYGVTIGAGYLVDTSQNANLDPLAPLISQFDPGPITKGIFRVLFIGGTSVTPAKTPPQGWTVSPVAESSRLSWLQGDPTTIQNDPTKDPQGPLTVAVSVEQAPPAGQQPGTNARVARLVFIGDDLAFSNNLMGVNGIENQDFLLNSVNWLTANEDLIAISAKPTANRSLFLSSSQLNFMLFSSAVFLPLAVLAVGAITYWSRR